MIIIDYRTALYCGTDTQKAQCYTTVRNGQCFDPSSTTATKSTCCCMAEGRGWGHPCTPCPATTDPVYRELCPHGPGLTNGGAGTPLYTMAILRVEYQYEMPFK